MDDLRLLHRDISIGNILLSRPVGREDAVGLLIDFDYSDKLETDATHDVHDAHNVPNELGEWLAEEPTVANDNQTAGSVCAGANQGEWSAEADEDEDEVNEVWERIWTVCAF
jgi:Fungal protein kinase